MRHLIASLLMDHVRTIVNLNDQSDALDKAIALIISTLRAGNAVYICGNGGSAADANHFAAELAGRFYITDRKALPVTSLLGNSSMITAVANDFGYEYIFSRQIVGVSKAGDIVIGISTSGKSKNVIIALQIAKQNNCSTIALVGSFTEEVSPFSDVVLSVNNSDVPRIQEAHTLMLHIIAESVERNYFLKVTGETDSSERTILESPPL